MQYLEKNSILDTLVSIKNSLDDQNNDKYEIMGTLTVCNELLKY